MLFSNTWPPIYKSKTNGPTLILWNIIYKYKERYIYIFRSHADAYSGFQDCYKHCELTC